MDKFRAQGLLWSRNNVSEKTSVRFVRLCELIFARKNGIICQTEPLVSHKTHRKLPI